MYVMLGATGQVGSNVLKTLQELEPDARIRIVARRRPDRLEESIEWHAADVMHDVENLASAFQGATAVFVMNPVPPDAEDVYRDAAKISATIAAAIEQAGHPRIVALSSQGAHLPEGTGVITALHDFETALHRTGAPLAYVRSTFFMESWLPFAAAAMETGQWWAMRDPPDMQDSAVSARDVGAVIAECLLDRGYYAAPLRRTTALRRTPGPARRSMRLARWICRYRKVRARQSRCQRAPSGECRPARRDRRAQGARRQGGRQVRQSVSCACIGTPACKRGGWHLNGGLHGVRNVQGSLHVTTHAARFVVRCARINMVSDQ